MKKRAIDLQLIKPVSGKTNLKGKMLLGDLFKEYLTHFRVMFLDPCCEEEDGVLCPLISGDDGNILECRNDGLYVPPSESSGPTECCVNLVFTAGFFSSFNVDFMIGHPDYDSVKVDENQEICYHPSFLAHFVVYDNPDPGAEFNVLVQLDGNYTTFGPFPAGSLMPMENLWLNALCGATLTFSVVP